jgi:HEAT repeat protein
LIISIGKIKPEEKDIIFKLAEKLYDEEVKVRRAAADILVDMGNELIIPDLVLAWAYEDIQTRLSTFRAIQSIESDVQIFSVLMKYLQHQNIEKKIKVVKAFINWKSKISPSKDELFSFMSKLFQDEHLLTQLDYETKEKLAQIFVDEKAMQKKVIKFIQDKSNEKSKQIAFIKNIGSFGQFIDGTFINELDKILNQEKDAEIIIALINTLETIDFYNNIIPEKVNKTLGEKLKHKDSEVRKNAAELLGKLAFENGKTLDLLVELFEDDSAEVRKKAVIAFGNIGHLTENIISKLFDLLNDNNEEVQIAAAKILGRMKVQKFGGMKMQKVVSKLLNLLLEDNNNNVKRTAAQSLERINIDVADVNLIVPKLCNILNDNKDKQVRRVVLTILKQLE